MFHRNTEEEIFSQRKFKIIDRDLLTKNPLKNDQIFEKPNPFYTKEIFAWYRKLNGQIRSMMKSGCSQQKLLVLMDDYIDSLKNNRTTYIGYTNRCSWLANKISCTLLLFRDLNGTSMETNEYLIKICELLSFYTYLELIFSSKFNTSKVSIAERISSNYDVHLKDANISYTLRVFLCIPNLCNEKEIMSKIFQKYLNRQQHITQTEIPDRLYCMYLIAYSKWISLESDDYEKVKICESANKRIKPMHSLSSNKSYAPYLPVYEHTDCDTTKHILSKGLNTRCLSNVLQNEECRKENVVIIDLSESDTSASNILEDTSWTNISPSDQNKTSVKIESPLIIDIIDLTKEESLVWEVSWLNELLRKSRTSLPALNIFAYNLVDALEVINIQDDDDENNSEGDSNQFTNGCKATEQSLSIVENSVMEDNSLLNYDTCSTPKENSKEILEKSPTKKMETIKKDKNSSSHKNTNDPLVEEIEKITVSPKLYEKNIYNSKKLYNSDVNQFNSPTSNDFFVAKTPKDASIMSNIEIFENEEDAEDINSPPVECFSESDADELVQLIDKNTKEANATNVYVNQEKQRSSIPLISETSHSHTEPVPNSNTRKVSFAKLPEKHVATSCYFSNKSVRHTNKNQLVKKYDDELTTQSTINTSLSSPDFNFNQSKPTCNTPATTSIISSVQDFIPSTDSTSSPMSNLSHQNKDSGKFDYLFKKKFPVPTYRNLDNLDLSSVKKTKNIDMHPNNKIPQINLYNGTNRKSINKIDTEYILHKKHKSDFDRYLEKLKEKRNKTISTSKEFVEKKPLKSHKNKSEKKTKPKKIFNMYDSKKVEQQFVDKKLRQKSYVKVERINVSQYTTPKLNDFHKVKEKGCHNSIVFSNPYVRIKRIKNIKLNNTKELETANKIPKFENDTIGKSNLSRKNRLEINSTVNDYYNIGNQSHIITENRNNRKNNKTNLIPPLNAGQNSSHLQQKREKIVTSQSEDPTIYQKIQNSINDYIEMCNNVQQPQLEDPESEVTSTQDNGDSLGECKISSTQDISNENINNSVQNNEIDTSQQVRHRRNRKSSLHSTNSHLSAKNEIWNKQEPNFFGQGSSNKDLNEPTTTTLNITTKKRGRKRKYIKKYKPKKENSNNIGEFSYSQSGQSSSLQTEIYSVFGDLQSENSTVAKTYSMHNLVSTVFVPPEIEKNFVDMT